MKEQINIDTTKLQATCDLMHKITKSFSVLVADMKELKKSNPAMAEYAKNLMFSAALQILANELQAKAEVSENDLDTIILGIAAK